LTFPVAGLAQVTYQIIGPQVHQIQRPQPAAAAATPAAATGLPAATAAANHLAAFYTK